MFQKDLGSFGGRQERHEVPEDFRVVQRGFKRFPGRPVTQEVAAADKNVSGSFR